MQVKLNPSLKSLSIESRVIAIESLSVHFPNRAMLGKLSELASGVSRFITEKTEALFSRGDVNYPSLTGSVVTSLKNNKYIDMSSMEVPCPEGLRVSFLELIAIIEDAQKITSNIVEDCLYPFSVYVSEALNKPERTESALRTSNVTLHNLDGVRNKLKLAFDGVHSTLPYGKVVSRNADWDEVEKRLQKILALQKRTSNKLVAEKVANLDVDLSTLISRMQDTNQPYRPTSELVSELSKLAYGLAEQVTFYSIICVTIESFIVSVEAAKKTIKAVKK